MGCAGAEQGPLGALELPTAEQGKEGPSSEWSQQGKSLNLGVRLLGALGMVRLGSLLSKLTSSELCSHVFTFKLLAS